MPAAHALVVVNYLKYAHQVMLIAYKNPRLNIKIRDALVRLLTCSVQIKGTGIMASTTSVRMFITAIVNTQEAAKTSVILTAVQ